MACVIFCAGQLGAVKRKISADDLLIAADGGLRHIKKLDLKANIILGDFDSLGYVPEGAAVFPVEKDDTDAMLAVKIGLQRGQREFYLYGSLDGPRLDHTVANFALLQYLADRGAMGYLIGMSQIVTMVKDSRILFPTGMKGNISVFPWGGDARGVTIRGLHYPLEDGCLETGFPLGVSNHFKGREAEISVRDGSLLLIWDREN